MNQASQTNSVSKKASRKKAKRSRTQPQDFEKKHVETVVPPEAVPLHFTRSSLGTRIAAQLLDILITYGALFVLFLLLIWSGILRGDGFWVFLYMASFFVRMPYYVLSELVWNGQTLGKKLLKICVISADGRSLEPYQIFARNLIKEAEVFFPIGLLFGLGQVGWLGNIIILFWLILVTMTPIISKKNQRIGDMIAGSLVIEKPKAVLLKDLSVNSGKSEFHFVFEPSQLDTYGRFELQTLEDILREDPKTDYERARIDKVAKTIHKKVKYPDPIPAGKERVFLMDFYTQERRYLEERNLFGDRRENKFYNAELQG